MTLLLPYILTTRKNFKNCTLRVFSLANKAAELDREQRYVQCIELSHFKLRGIIILNPTPLDSCLSQRRVRIVEAHETDSATLNPEDR